MMIRFFLLVMTCLFSSHLIAQKATLTIKITNIETIAGDIRLALYDKAEDFPDENKVYRHAIVQVTSSEVTLDIDALDYGTYAIALLHDENKDGKCNYNMIGIPTEGYGFSNNVKPFLKAPPFEKTKFDFSEDTTMEIELIN